MQDKTPPTRMVNHAPSGNFNNADERKSRSRVPKTKKPPSTIMILSRQTTIATTDTRNVVMNVTITTQTP
jgi:hypothetical protein